MVNPSGQFCPVCKFKNEPDAVVCAHCGSMLEDNLEEALKTNRLDEPSLISDAAKNPLDKEFMPPVGLGIYLENTAPVTVIDEKEFVLGRKMEGALEYVVDLTPFGAFQMGVSRRHAKVTETKEGYEISDLESTNGTWVDKKQITPNKPWPLRSGSVVQLGRMRLLFIFNKPGK
jgi:hypothetical protein